MDLIIRGLIRALGLGDTPPPCPTPAVRGMTAEDFARAHGANEAWLRKWQSVLGKRMQELYIAEYGEQPPQTTQIINGGERRVNLYPYGRQRCMYKAWLDFEPANELST